MKETNITIIIHTFNEESNIQECIESAKLLTGHIIVIDMGSEDNTVTIARNNGAKIFTFPFSHYVEPARKFGIEKADTDWVFILDADERITEELAKEIAARTDSVEDPDVASGGKTELVNENITAYKIPRKNIFGRKKWLKHGGWWPDYQIRLINKKYFEGWPNEIHSTPVINGNIGYFNNPFLHFFHGDFEKMVEKTIIFEDIESDLLYKANRKVKTSTFFRKFLGELYRRLFKNLGFLDGTIGIIESIYQAFSKTVTYLYLYEKKNRSL